MAAPDHVDRLVEQWRTERPDLDLDAMATVARLGRLHAHTTRAIEAVFQRHGLSIGEFDVLAALRRAGEPYEQRPTQLASTLMLSPAGMTNRLDRLEKRGWLERRSDPDDRRSWIVALTAAGRAVVDAAVTDHVANEHRMLAGLTAAQRRALDAAVRALLVQFEDGTA